MSIKRLALASLLLATPAAALDDRINLPGDGNWEFEIEPQDPAVTCSNKFIEKTGQLIASGVNLGAPTGPIVLVDAGTWCFQVFANGRLYTTAPAGGSHAYAVYGPSLALYSAYNFHAGFLNRPMSDPQPNGVAGGTRQTFLGGIINHHPALGTHAVASNISWLWFLNGGSDERFGHPLTGPQGGGVPGASFNIFEHGFGAFIPGWGAFIDYTGVANEGQVSGSVTGYLHGAFGGTSVQRSLSSQSPVALRASLGAHDNNLSSFVLSNVPARASVYLFDGSPMSGRHVRISGANGASVRVSNIGTWMNDRTSSMMLVNHGTASLRLGAASLQTLVQDALDALDTTALMDAALEGEDASGSLTWSGPATVTLIPGERLVHISRRAYMDVNADCALVFNCNADGDVQFDVFLRPFVQDDFLVHGDFVRGTATSISCSGRGCDTRAAALADLFSNQALITSVEDTVDTAMNDQEIALMILSAVCDDEINIRRIHVLPDAVEVVLADTAAAGACAAAEADGQLSTVRTAGRVENSDGTVITTGVTIVANPRGGLIGGIGGGMFAR